VYTTDPRIVPEARRLDQISFEEMLELASLGAKVLQIRSVEFASKYAVPLRVLSSFEAGKGTLITSEENIVEQPIISGITYNRDEAKVTIRGVPDTPGIAHRILGVISDEHINVDMIIQNISDEGLTDFTFTVPSSEMAKSLQVLQPLVKKLNAQEVVADDDLAKISVVGIGMRSHEGIATTMFKALSEKGINIQMISTSEIKISVTIRKVFTELPVRTLLAAFELEK
jgi:aspartate kinase